METAGKDDFRGLSSRLNTCCKTWYKAQHMFYKLLIQSSSQTSVELDGEKSKVKYSAHIEDVEVNRDCLAGYLRDIRDALLKCTKPCPSKGERSDLSIWREIFALYDSSSVFCQARECSSVDLDFGAVRTRYESFLSCITAANHVRFHQSRTLITLHTDPTISTSSKCTSLHRVQRSSRFHNRSFSSEVKRSFRHGRQGSSTEFIFRARSHLELQTPRMFDC
jgi:hypothetical protein